MDDLLLSYCKQLHFGSSIIENARQITCEDNLAFLTELFKLEIENRELKRKNTYIKQARFDVLKTFKDYTFEDIDMPKSISPEEIMAAQLRAQK